MVRFPTEIVDVSRYSDVQMMTTEMPLIVVRVRLIDAQWPVMRYGE
jgi:hypothetical protein